MCSILERYATYYGNSLLMLRDNTVPIFKNKAFLLDFLTLEDGTDRFYRNVIEEFRVYAA